VSKIAFLENRSAFFWGCTGLGLVLLLGLVDSLTGNEFGFSIFYLVPIALVTWYATRRLGLLVAAASAAAWFGAEIAGGNRHANQGFYLWDTLIQLGFFVVVTALLSKLREAFTANQELARSDYVTGATSARYFYELARAEIERCKRTGKPFSLAYMDLDDFKEVNDRFGHVAGDKVLRELTSTIKAGIRSMDTFARLGGDEFGLLLPETGAVGARAVISRVQQLLAAMRSDEKWRATVSVGVMTYTKAPDSVEEMIQMADNAMYSVKSGEKNGVVYQVHDE
jgi:diguanylate cyclase (GGDEF)-like protein